MAEVVSLTQGLPGAGKTFTRGVLFLLDFLENEDGTYYHNLPLYPEKFAEHFREKYGDEGAERVLQRIHKIPEDVELSWLLAESGPWDYFAEMDLQNAWIAFDEAHTIADRDHPKNHNKKWKRFLGELRHRGCQLEFITQNVQKLHPSVVLDAAIRRTIQSTDEIPDELCEIPQGDWNQLRSAITGSKKSSCVEVTERRGIGGKWLEVSREVHPLEPKYFEFYNSFSEPKHGGLAGKRTEPYERYGKLGLFAWFVRRNAESLIMKNPFLRLLLLSVAGVWLSSWASSRGKKMIAEPQTPAVAEQQSSGQRFVSAVTQSQSVAPEVEQPSQTLAAVTAQSCVMSDGVRKWLGDEIDGSKILGFEPDQGVVFTVAKRLRLGEASRLPQRTVPPGIPSGSSIDGGTGQEDGRTDGQLRGGTVTLRPAPARTVPRDGSSGNPR